MDPSIGEAVYQNPELPEKSKPKRKTLLIVLGVFVLGVFISLVLVFCAAYAFNYWLVRREVVIDGAMPMLTQSPRGGVEPSLEDRNSWVTSSDEWGIVSFLHPKDWKVTTHIVSKGDVESGLSGDMVAEPGDVEVLYIQNKNGDGIRMEIRRDIVSKQCGGVGGYTKEEYDLQLQRRTRMVFLGGKVYRANLANGQFDMGADAPSVYYQPILFETAPYTVNDPNNIYNGQSLYSLAFCYENSSLPVEIRVGYVSDSFTEDNIVNRKLDNNLLSGMDEILSTFVLTSKNKTSQ